MPTQTPKKLRIPKHRHHSHTGRGVVTLDGRDHYTGKWGTPECEEQYRRLIAEWLANGRRQPAAATAPTPGAEAEQGVSVADLIADYLRRHVETEYRRPDGSQGSEYHSFRAALQPLLSTYGTKLGLEFEHAPQSFGSSRTYDAVLASRSLALRAYAVNSDVLPLCRRSYQCATR